jgi:hypothetical protein
MRCEDDIIIIGYLGYLSVDEERVGEGHRVYVAISRIGTKKSIQRIRRRRGLPSTGT